MDEISNLFGMFLAVVALANPAKRNIPWQSPPEASVVNNAKELEVSFLKLMDEHQGIIDKISHLYSNSPQDRADLCQTILGNLWETYPTFRGVSKLSTWIYTVAVRAAIQPFRRKIRIQIVSQEVLPDSPEEDPTAFEMDDRLLRQFNKLAKYERAILMLLIEGYNRKEIGVMLKMSENAVNVRMTRMRKIIERE